MRTTRPLSAVCRALLAVLPGESLGLPPRQRSELWAYMRECEDGRPNATLEFISDALDEMRGAK